MYSLEEKFANFLNDVKVNNKRPLWQTLIADLLIAGIFLCTFSLFHHVIPQEGSEGTELLYSSASYTHTLGQFGDRFPDKFTTDGSIEKTDSTYKSSDINISITKHSKNDITYYVADIYVKNIESFRTGLAKDKYGKGYDDTIPDMAEENDAILAINGDYYGNSSKRGTVIRNGIYYRGNTYRHTCVLYRDGTMVTYYEDEYDIDKVLENNPWQAWSFGPMLIDRQGNAIPEFDTSLSQHNPRTAIGYYEPGHYCFVIVDGRQKGYSEGITLPDLSQLMVDLGCKTAYNLDGGQSSEMYYNGKTVNRPVDGGREQSDIIYIGKEN